MAKVELFKKQVKYTDSSNQEKTATNFYIQCGNELVPVQVRFFPKGEDNRDPLYAGRKMMLSSYADNLPERG